MATIFPPPNSIVSMPGKYSPRSATAALAEFHSRQQQELYYRYQDQFLRRQQEDLYRTAASIVQDTCKETPKTLRQELQEELNDWLKGIYSWKL